jgi:hypothetical protein
VLFERAVELNWVVNDNLVDMALIDSVRSGEFQLRQKMMYASMTPARLDDSMAARRIVESGGFLRQTFDVECLLAEAKSEGASAYAKNLLEACQQWREALDWLLEAADDDVCEYVESRALGSLAVVCLAKAYEKLDSVSQFVCYVTFEEKESIRVVCEELLRVDPACRNALLVHYVALRFPGISVVLTEEPFEQDVYETIELEVGVGMSTSNVTRQAPTADSRAVARISLSCCRTLFHMISQSCACV